MSKIFKIFSVDIKDLAVSNNIPLNKQKKNGFILIKIINRTNKN